MGPADLQALLRLERLLHGFRSAAHRLGQNMQVFEADGHFDDELGIVADPALADPLRQAMASFVSFIRATQADAT